MKTVLALILAIVTAGVLATSGAAGKPTKPYLDVSPAEPADTFTLSGCGYARLTTIIVWHQEVTPDENGCVSATFTAWGSGLYEAQAWQQHGDHWENNPSATTSFVIA
jgi:hypothetical protein